MQILRLLSVELKFSKFLMLLFKGQVSSTSHVASFFSVAAHESSVLFCIKHNTLSTKIAHQKAIFRLLTARMKTNQIPYVIFQATRQFSFRFCITLQCHDT